MRDRAQDIAEALELIDHGLNYHLSLHARELVEDALVLLKQGREPEAVDALCEALARCDDPMALHHLVAARDLLAPDRFTSA